ncbi:MAG: YidC/Oxa1 family membrane protein insertase, partial [Candidatus Dormibacteria bacterium]
MRGVTSLYVLMGAFDFLKPVGQVIGAIVGVLRIPFIFILKNLYAAFHAVGPIDAIGAYGMAIIVMTVAIKLALFPLFQKQLTMGKKTQEEQRRIGPELSALRKKYKGQTTSPEFISAQSALYKEHGINPFGSLAGCLPTLAQLPILIGLYQAIYNFHDKHIDAHFLWVHDLVQSASTAHPITWILPLIAGATTFAQSKMMAPPPAAAGDDSQAAQMAQMTSTMSLLMPGMIIFFAFQKNVQQALVLYWIVSNLFSVAQQYRVNGWGQMPFLGNKNPATAAVAGGNGRPERNGHGGGNGRGNGSAGSVPGKADIVVAD